MPHKRTIPCTCLTCGREFLADAYEISRGYAKYCTNRCVGDRNGAGPAARLRARTRLGPDCWDWTGYRKHHGYGVIHVDGRLMATHRLAWQLVHGPIPDGLVVAHRCDRPSCVRPDHLFLTTQDGNIVDRDAKKRGGTQSLTEAEVREIRHLYASFRWGYRVLARRFGVSITGIAHIVNRRTWAHLE